MRIEIILTKKEDSYCNSIKTFNSLFLTDSNISIDSHKNRFKYDVYEVEYSCTTGITNKGDERFFLISLNSIEDDTEKSLESLRVISRIIKKHIKESNKQFTENVIWDEVSQYYCKKGYPIINEIENLMRKLIYIFIVSNVGSTWLSRSSPDEFKSKVKSNAQKNKVQSTEENALYEADFIQLSDFLFTPYTTITVNELYNMLDKESDIEKLREYIPKSNWQRYFESHIKFNNLNEEWSKLYNLRNMVAHNKLISKGDFENLQKLSQKISKVLNEAIENIQKITIPKEDIQNVVSRVETTVQRGRFILRTIKKYLELSNREKRCFLCDCFIEDEDISYEYLIPISTIGEEGDNLWNLVMVHRSCGAYKSNRMPSAKLIKKLNTRNENLMKIFESEGIKDKEVIEFKEFVNNNILWSIWDRIKNGETK